MSSKCPLWPETVPLPEESDSEDSSGDSEEAEAQSLWEAQQIEKGVKRPQVSLFMYVAFYIALHDIVTVRLGYSDILSHQGSVANATSSRNISVFS